MPPNQDKKARMRVLEPQLSPQKNRWQALRTATEKAAREGDRFRFSSELVRVRRL